MMIPPSRPRAPKQKVADAAEAQWRKFSNGPMPRLYLAAFRPYYTESMGKPGNSRGKYDDAVFIVSDEVFAPFNANTDPSVYRKGIATLKLGVHWYRKGNHGISRPGGGYPAFRPATKNEELPVERDGIQVPWPGVAINIHKGGYKTTSSEGCQTIYPDQWDAFYKSLSGEMDRLKVDKFPYILIQGPLV